MIADELSRNKPGKAGEHLRDMLLPAGREDLPLTRYRTAAWIRLCFVLPVLYGFTLYMLLCSAQAKAQYPAFRIATHAWLASAALYAAANVLSLLIRNVRVCAAFAASCLVLELLSNEIIVYVTGTLASHALLFIIISVAVYRVYFDYRLGLAAAVLGTALHLADVSLLLTGLLPPALPGQAGAAADDLALASAIALAIGVAITFSTINLGINRMHRMKTLITQSWKKDLDSIEQFNEQVNNCGDESGICLETIRAVRYATPLGKVAVLEDTGGGSLAVLAAHGWGDAALSAMAGGFAGRLPQNNRVETLPDVAGGGGSAFCFSLECDAGRPAYLVVGKEGLAQLDGHGHSMLLNIAQSAGGAVSTLRRVQLERQKADTDELTGLYNRRWLAAQWPRLLQEAKNAGRPVCIAMFDIDHFKHYNDDFGHLAGDRLLRLVAGAIASSMREGDAVARFGGEEFVALLMDADSARGAAVAERVRAAVQQIAGGERPVTVSGGIAACPPDSGEADELLACADKRLYEAKRLGRNRICSIIH